MPHSLSSSKPTPFASPPPASVRRVADRLRRHIREGKWDPGDKMPTIQHLSREEGVSAHQARKAVLLLQHEGLLTTHRGAGTFVADPHASATDPPATQHATPTQQATHHSASLPQPAAASPYGSTLRTRQVILLASPERDDQLERMAAALAGRFQGSDLALHRQQLDPAQTITQQLHGLKQRSVTPPHGVIFFRYQHGLEQSVREVFGEDPIVIEAMGDAPAGHVTHRVGPDYHAVREIAARRLLGPGHARIGLVTHLRTGPVGQPDEQAGRGSARNLGLTELGRFIRQRLGRGAFTVHRQHGSAARRVDDLVQWLSRPDRPTAIYGSDFRIAMVIRAAERLGLRIPDDLDVLGEGNTMWAEEFDFPSIDLRLGEIVAHIAALLERDPAEMRHSRSRFLVKPRLIERPETRNQQPLTP